MSPAYSPVSPEGSAGFAHEGRGDLSGRDADASDGGLAGGGVLDGRAADSGGALGDAVLDLPVPGGAVEPRGGGAVEPREVAALSAPTPALVGLPPGSDAASLDVPLDVASRAVAAAVALPTGVDSAVDVVRQPPVLVPPKKGARRRGGLFLPALAEVLKVDAPCKDVIAWSEDGQDIMIFDTSRYVRRPGGVWRVYETRFARVR